ncbi:MAG: Dabb family protein [Candidatus Nitrohelix vancouverensis]|uniref:Dabb family protein n=1 Tax=Candidatus Nitrohelix vancouverensis TaxID=2705534 RepID=A0A7T0C464_9BACT|nr:MAG: Dabb family protein [Candidatus Nitrohelix vancouverensis]
MIKHIVMFKLENKTKENMEQAIASLKSLEGAIESLRFIEVGVDFKSSERSFDLVLTTHFDDKEGLETYAAHPNHQPVIKTIRSLCKQSVVVDYEI